MTDRTLIKIDTQGNEMKVLFGASETLEKILMIEIELSVTPIYDGQPLILDVLHYLDAHGYTLVDLEPLGRDRQQGHYPQFDGILVRSH